MKRPITPNIHEISSGRFRRRFRRTMQSYRTDDFGLSTIKAFLVTQREIITPQLNVFLGTTLSVALNA